jgi:hypothetical protein
VNGFLHEITEDPNEPKKLSISIGQIKSNSQMFEQSGTKSPPDLPPPDKGLDTKAHTTQIRGAQEHTCALRHIQTKFLFDWPSPPFKYPNNKYPTITKWVSWSDADRFVAVWPLALSGCARVVNKVSVLFCVSFLNYLWKFLKVQNKSINPSNHWTLLRHMQKTKTGKKNVFNISLSYTRY